MAWALKSRRGKPEVDAADEPDSAPVPAGNGDGASVDDGQLIARHLAGDPAVFEVLYRRHAGPLFRTALAMTGSRMEAEEMLQETFLRAYRHLRNVRLATNASLRPWLHRILVHLIYDRWARRQPEASAYEPGIERLTAERATSPERRAEEREVARVVTEALACLPFKQRIVAALFYLDDMDVEEIAATIGVPQGTVKSRLYYGRARLRKLLAADARMPALPANVPAAELQQIV